MKNIKTSLKQIFVLTLCSLLAGCQTTTGDDIGGGHTPPRQLSIGGTQAAPRTLAAGEQTITGGSYPIVNVEEISAVGIYAPSYGK